MYTYRQTHTTTDRTTNLIISSNVHLVPLAEIIISSRQTYGHSSATIRRLRVLQCCSYAYVKRSVYAVSQVMLWYAYILTIMDVYCLND